MSEKFQLQDQSAAVGHGSGEGVDPAEESRLKHKDILKINREAKKVLEMFEEEDLKKEEFPMSVRFQIGFIKLIAKYSKFVTGLFLKSFDRKVDREAEVLRSELERLSRIVEEKQIALDSAARLPEEASKNLLSELEEATKELQFFLDTRMVYHFSNKELADREEFLKKEAAEELKEILGLPQVHEELTEDEKQYMRLLGESQSARGYAMLFDNCTKKIQETDPDLGGRVRGYYNEAVDADVKLKEFIQDHHGIEEVVRRKVDFRD